MTMHVNRSEVSTADPLPWTTAKGYEDPLDPDAVDDRVVVTTRRSLIRVAMIAAEAGAHFRRDHITHDAMAWMLAPRRLFAGGSAIEACLDRAAFRRALLLHGLGLGLDADPGDVDDLVGDGDGDDDDDDDDASGAADAADDGDDLVASAPRLYTSLLVHETEDGTTQAFDATIAATVSEARSRLAARRGGALADAADIREGFDAHLPLVEALVSPAVADMLLQIAEAPGSPLARGLEVSIEQRFAA